jgi:hypothetical protein
MKSQQSWPFDYLVTSRAMGYAVHEYYMNERCQLAEEYLADHELEDVINELRAANNTQETLVNCVDVIFDVDTLIEVKHGEVKRYATTFRDSFRAASELRDLDWLLTGKGMVKDARRRLLVSCNQSVVRTYSNEDMFVSVIKRDSCYHLHFRSLKPTC